MRNLLRPVCCALALVCSLLAFAQDQTITGTVRDPRDNTPLAGATIVNKRTKKAVLTNDDGHFTAIARSGDVLIVSHIGRKTALLTVGAATSYAVQLEIETSEIGEAVVTAMDIKRNPRELGYSVQTVAGSTIAATQRENFITSLQGRVSGLTITATGGQAGASASIVLRGFNTLGGTNQPLFVVDGIIIDNTTFNENSYGGTGVGVAADLPNRNNDYTNRIADLNPNDIESLTVLKGPEATALYGSQASNGAIVIVTRKPKANGHLSLAYDNNFRTQKITRFAAVDNGYGPGTSNGIPTLPPLVGQFTSFGPAWPAGTQLYDNLHNFFRTGFSQTHNLATEFGFKNSGFRISGSYFTDEGVVPHNTYLRDNIRIVNSTKIGKYVDINPSIEYIHSNNLKPVKGASGYLEDLYSWPANYDIRNYQTAAGAKMILFQSNVNADYDNPLWSAKNNKSRDVTDRVIATLGIDIHPFSWLSLAGRFGYDTYEQDGYLFTHPESYLLSASTGGSLDNYYHRYNGYNHTITATAHKKFGNFNTRLLVGTMWQDLETKAWDVYGTHLKDSASTDSSNTLASSRIRLLRNQQGLPNLQITREIAYFGELSISWRDLIYLTYSHRFESASPLPAQNRNYNYPAASLSAIMSDIIPAIKNNNIVNYWKLRGSVAGTARLNDPYSNQSFFVNNLATQYIPSFGYGYTNANPYLQPERQRTFELGTELRLLNNAISLEGAYYNTYCYNQIAQQYRASYATGYILNTENAASTRNQGVELTVSVTPIKKTDFAWDIQFNFNHMWSKVLTLPASIGILNDYYNSDTYFSGNVRAGLIRGHSTGTITGFNYLKNNAGQILIDPGSGVAIQQQLNYSIGDRTPKFTLGTVNNFRYKNWNLSFLWDLKVGGDIYNGTDYFLTQIGKSARTSNRMKPIIVKGVLNDGYQNTAHPTQNNIVITPYFNSFYYTNLPDVEFVQHNVNWLRLRDITISYRLPETVTKRVNGMKSLSVFATANNLVMLTNYAGADPDVQGNNPGTRGVGSYGMDFGSPATPVSMSLGLRASF
ncbi:SusC/RagA family TonB-linked outer membrane protein [Puia dinghuensis]|uniref:SusC/RagA family TonB-linked outer membrane protein n=1 Tax=Puia dinghuensis TaxID=1792502 RepID=A0A8J2UC23_9BACT|nr:SusC/RagA family TonB-linked outer membrane protein [Puia dinghuensis]GGA96458.1 SusC/RagA family TonB-linked outer membrane protein [Puia dinghuensis]